MRGDYTLRLLFLQRNFARALGTPRQKQGILSLRPSGNTSMMDTICGANRGVLKWTDNSHKSCMVSYNQELHIQ
jgi:hypothetical protein